MAYWGLQTGDRPALQAMSLKSPPTGKFFKRVRENSDFCAQISTRSAWIPERTVKIGAKRRLPMAGRLSRFISALRTGLVSDVPPEFQACESCREPTCDSIKAAGCVARRDGEEQERSRRFTETGRSGTHVIGGAESSGFDVPLGRMAGTPPKSEVRSTVEPSNGSDSAPETLQSRRQTTHIKTG